MDDKAKIYGLCLQRLNYQIKNAKQRINGNGSHADIFLLECYNTGDVDDIIDILELYDIDERTIESVMNKLDDLAYTVSALTCETLSFGFTEKGYLGLYLEAGKEYEA
ncbi:MAG: hypothetical protein QMD07_04345 [Thermodesulfovibrionales bacterium]|nr:hypothetical protein [Thermodesulfovibrionales bacterium]